MLERTKQILVSTLLDRGILKKGSDAVKFLFLLSEERHVNEERMREIEVEARDLLSEDSSESDPEVTGEVRRD